VLSQTAEYALRTAAFLARRADAPVRIDEIAAALGIPRNYLSKILHRLAREGVLASTRGRNGGFRLARPAGRISLLEVVEPFDRIDARRQCLLGREVCSDERACEAHVAWKQVGARIAAFFTGTTLADLAGAPLVRRGRPAARV
jgi:Rrf2 family protein